MPDIGCALPSPMRLCNRLYYGSQKTPKKIATRNDGFSGFAEPGTAFRTGQMS
ncbi:hypothetical protein [Mesorhizobium sp. WSM4884]|uniref:hypothetical protein n=1 Tax=Mesorhizobium sp. WSM4884 TaxID=3038542 RepID=UPI0024177540|nr:hypothetical protein [Mesorhizobium sp. WSM4884]MDG4881722.1 hypothetical protein [Mesorhizobium sp. WSM4884]